MKYNASVQEFLNGELWGTFAAEVNERGEMLRSNALQCTGFEGKYLKNGRSAYDVYYRERYPNLKLVILRDNCQCYMNKLGIK